MKYRDGGGNDQNFSNGLSREKSGRARKEADEMGRFEGSNDLYDQGGNRIESKERPQPRDMGDIHNGTEKEQPDTVLMQSLTMDELSEDEFQKCTR